MDVLFLLIGFALLVAGAEGLVRGGSGLALRFGVSPLLIGLTVVAYGTSAPELVVSLDAAWSGNVDITVGNAVGSNIFNILCALGVIAVIQPITVRTTTILRDGGTALGATVLFMLAALIWGAIYWPIALLFLVLLIAQTVEGYWRETRAVPRAVATAPAAASTAGAGGDTIVHVPHAEEAETIESAPQDLWLAVVMLVGGLGLLIWGADLMVGAAVSIARALGVSEAIIGLSLVALGTSLPELATGVVAALRRQADLALGNVIGSCTYNILAIMGLSGLIADLRVAPGILAVDMWIMLLATLLLLPPLWLGHRIDRRYGIGLLTGYGLYIVYLAISAIVWPASA